jgi:FMN phosphatase YigB (HAD superfamily)
MIIIFDLDRTIFDTEKFKKDIAKVLNIGNKQYNKDCKKYFSDKKKVYNPYELLRMLKSEKRIPLIKNYQIKLEALVKNANKYLLLGALDVLKKFKNRGDKLILISVGYKPWQKKKINNLNLKKYFDRIIILEKEKHNNLDFLKKKKDKILIINDDAGEALDMKKVIGKCEVCLIRGPYSKNKKHNLKLYNIKDCLKFYD